MTLFRWSWPVCVAVAVVVAVAMWGPLAVGTALLWSSVWLAALGCVLVVIAARANLRSVGVGLTYQDVIHQRAEAEERDFAARTRRYALLTWLAAAAALVVGLLLRTVA